MMDPKTRAQYVARMVRSIARHVSDPPARRDRPVARHAQPPERHDCPPASHNCPPASLNHPPASPRRRPLPRLAGRRLATIVLAALAATSCGPDTRELRARDERPNILIVSLDTTRADHLSAYGYARPTSPRLEQLAEEGVRFESAYAPSATTGPTHASLFTALPPMAHDVRKNGQPLAEALPTLAERLSATGFETAGVVSSFVLSERFGFAQGFDAWDEDFSQATAPEGVTVWEGLEIEGKFYGSAEDTTRRALGWLDARAHPDRPFLLFVHYFDPHDPYTPPPGFSPPFEAGPKAALKQVRTTFLYDWLLAFTDAQMGALLDGLGERALEDDTLVVVLGDHGEGLMDHGHAYHGAQIYEEAVRVPFVARWPGRIAGGAVVETPTSISDLAPTLLAILGEPTGDLAPGARERRNRLLGEAGEEPLEPVFFYRRHYEAAELPGGIEVVGEQFGVREGRWKLIDAPEEDRTELYDLVADPDERVDLSKVEPERMAALQAHLAAWRAEAERHREAWQAEAGLGPSGKEAVLDEEARARLEALGYVE